MKNHKYWIVLVLSISSLSVFGQAILTPNQISDGYYVKDDSSIVQRLIWNKAPLKISIPYQKERIISFQNTVEVKIAKENFPYLRIMTVGTTTYWFLREQLPAPIRLQVVDKVTNEIFIVDVAETEDATDIYPIEILSEIGSNSTSPTAHVPQLFKENKHPYEIMTRFASQEFYGISRLRKPVSGMTRVKISTQATYQTLIRDGEYLATPIAAWKYRDLFLTAIELKNSKSTELTWNPTKIRADFLVAAPQHQVLGPAGSSTDTTILYLITERPFVESIRQYVSN